MFEELGGLFGWLLVIFYMGTLLNYIVKAINKRFGKQLATKPKAKRFITLLMKVFVKNHKIFGFGTIVLLLAHFTIQFTMWGSNLTGGISAGLIITQVLLGIYGSSGNRKRAGGWFALHRIVSVLIILGIAAHLILPMLRENSLTKVENDTATVDREFTLEELATYTGENGTASYVAYEGKVYDVTDVPAWKNGKHNGQTAGRDLTKELSKSPHGDKVFENLSVVGKLK